MDFIFLLKRKSHYFPKCEPKCTYRYLNNIPFKKQVMWVRNLAELFPKTKPSSSHSTVEIGAPLQETFPWGVNCGTEPLKAVSSQSSGSHSPQLMSALQMIVIKPGTIVTVALFQLWRLS